MKIGLVATHKEILEDTHNLIREIKGYVDKVYVLMDKEQEVWDFGNVKYIVVPNEGLDFGKFYNFLKSYEEWFSELLLVNSTVSPLSSFDRLMKFVQRNDLDFSGATSAYTESEGSKPVNGYHIQSFFLYTKGGATKEIVDYILKTGIISKWEGVRQFEMGISRHMIEKGFKVGAFLEADYMMKKYGWKRCSLIEQMRGNDVAQEDGEFNGTFQYPETYIKEGLPFVKNSLQKYHYKPPIIQYLSALIYK